MFSINLLIFTLLACIFVQINIIRKYKILNEQNRAYVASVTHDLKSPVYAQINMLNLLLKGNFGQLTPQQYEMIELTKDSSKYMTGLVGNILTDYQCDCNSIHLSKSQFDLIKLVNNICSENQFNAEGKNQKIIFNHNSKNIIVFADKLQISRVITNLISNAITYGFNNTNIYVNLYQKENNLNFSVSNSSNPISQKELKNIFNKFSKTNNSKINKLSTGLGLHISKQIIKMHGGNIYAKSTPDGICSFGFILKATSKITPPLIKEG